MPTVRNVVVDTTASPFARLHPVPIDAVRLTDTFWQPRRLINAISTIPAQHRQCEETHRIDNFRRAAGKIAAEFVGIYFNDSDVYKWLEAAASALADSPAVLQPLIDATIREIADAQQPDGYLNTYFMLDRAGQRYTNLKDMHELYCAGHFIQAAVAHHRATGSDAALGIARRLADHLIATFGPIESGKKPGTSGHEEIEMALIELARATGEKKYLEQGRFFLDARGQNLAGGDAYHQDHLPIREQHHVVGHAVRMLYLTCGMTDLYLETGDAKLLHAIDQLWDNFTTRRMYVTGGAGARWEGEAFGKDYELPADRAYAETCAAIASVMWNWRLLQIDGDAAYADLMEWTLYNAVLPGLSLDGQHYFYQNPLSDDGTHRRQAWFGCACCPPNVARLLAQLPGYVASVEGSAIWLHLYAAGAIRATLASGQSVALTVAGDYPWDGALSITVESDAHFTLRLRLPGWCESGIKLTVNGHRTDGELKPGTYVAIDRTWKHGDVVHLTLPMPVRLIEAHPHLTDAAGAVAIARGPILFCVEAVDHQGVDVRDLRVDPKSTWAADRADDLQGRPMRLRSTGKRASDEAWANRLYRTMEKSAAATVITPIVAVPYFAWANRAAGAMRVWLARADR